MKTIHLLLLLTVLWSGLSHAQVNGQWGIPKWTASGLSWQWVNPANDKVFKINSSGALELASPGGGGTLASLSDVAVTSLATNQLLRYNGTSWVNYTPPFTSMNFTASEGGLSAEYRADFLKLNVMGFEYDLTYPLETGTLLTTASTIPITALEASGITINGSLVQLGQSVDTTPGGLTITSGAVSAVAVSQANATTTPTAGLSLITSTAAAAGSQRPSPRAVFTGQGWKTNATAASQAVSFGFSVTPVQGSAAPTGVFNIESDINGAGTWPDVLSISTDGVVSLPNGAGGTMTQFGSVASGMVRLAPGGQTAQIGTSGSATVVGFLYPNSTGAGSLHSDGAGNIAMRGYSDPTMAQEFAIYKTDSGANDELARMGWRQEANVYVIETVRTGTGTARPIQIRVNGTTAITISATGAITLNMPTSAGATGTLWNDGGAVKVAP